MKMLKGLHAKGNASKEEYADALRAYQAAVDATKSAEREKVERVWKEGKSVLLVWLSSHYRNKLDNIDHMKHYLTPRPVEIDMAFPFCSKDEHLFIES